MSETERLNKRIDDRLKGLARDINKLLGMVEERGQLIDALAREKEKLEDEVERPQVQDGESAGEYVERRIMDIFQEVAEHVGNGVFELEHPAPIIRGSIAMTNAWHKHLAALEAEGE